MIISILWWVVLDTRFNCLNALNFKLCEIGFNVFMFYLLSVSPCIDSTGFIETS